MLIGLVANKQSGKSTFSDYLVKKYGFKTQAFADPIKDGCNIFFDFNKDQSEGVLKEIVDERWGVSPRMVYQRIGTNVFRNMLQEVFPELKDVGNQFWIERFKIWYRRNMDKDIVVSDIRFPNEAQLIKDMGGTIVKIKRNGIKNNDQHISEQLIDTIKEDALIKNDCSIQKYYEHIDTFMSGI